MQRPFLTHGPLKNRQWAEFGLWARLCWLPSKSINPLSYQKEKNNKELFVTFNKLSQMCFKVHVICLKGGTIFFSFLRKIQIILALGKFYKNQQLLICFYIKSPWQKHCQKECFIMQRYDVSFVYNQLPCQSSNAIDRCDIMSGHSQFDW